MSDVIESKDASESAVLSVAALTPLVILALAPVEVLAVLAPVSVLVALVRLPILLIVVERDIAAEEKAVLL
jgi:hypothetical protein